MRLCSVQFVYIPNDSNMPLKSAKQRKLYQRCPELPYSLVCCPLQIGSTPHGNPHNTTELFLTSEKSPYPNWLPDVNIINACLAHQMKYLYNFHVALFE